VYRLFRDAAYGFGGLLSGVVADAYGVPVSLTALGVYLLLAAIYAHVGMFPDSKLSRS
jgi:hypothetical protein